MTRAERVLVLDAAPETVRMLGRACRELGHGIIAASWPLPPGLTHEIFGLVVVDVHAGPARATQILRQLQQRATSATTPCIVVCDQLHEPELTALIEAGADDFVRRDLPELELRSRLRLHLRMQLTAARVVRRIGALSVMLEITEALVSSIDIQEILYTVVRRIADVVRVDRASIVLVPDEAGSHGFVVAASDDAGLTHLPLELAKYPEIRHVLRNKTPLTIADVGTHPVLVGVRNAVLELGLASLTLIPMIFKGSVRGVLFLRAHHKLGALDEQQIGFCRVLANATAIALHNAQMFQQATQEANSLPSEPERRLAPLRRYADVFESAADGIAALDEQARLLYANPGAYQMLGYEDGEFPIGAKVFQLVVPADRRKLLGQRRAFAAGDFPRNLELRVQRNDGRVIVISCSFSRLHSQDSALLLSFRDVTEPQRIQEELVQTRNFLQSLIDASVDAIVAANMKGQIILFNAGAERLYARKREDVIQKLHVRALYPDDGAATVGRMLKSQARGGVGRLEQVRMEAIDVHGNVFPISLTAATIYEHGVPVATFGIFTDLRERVRVEEQLAQAQEKLALSERQSVLVELAGATAHELNQPLTSVMGYAELLTRKIDPSAPAHRAATVIQQEAQRMAEIVRKIGRLTRYETKSYVGEQRIVDLDRASEDEPGPGNPR
jgi:PAS domain S-box-containing protein